MILRNKTRLGGPPPPTGTGFRHITAGVEDAAAKLVESADVHSNLKDPVAATAGLRTLGTGAQTACAGNDARLSDSRAPSGTASGDLTGSYPGPTVAADAIDNTKAANMVQARIKGRQAAGGTGDPEDLTPNQAQTVLDGATDPYVKASDTIFDYVEVPLGFTKNNPAASQTAAIMNTIGTAGHATWAAGSLVGFSANFNNTFTAGQIKFRIRKNGAADTAVELTLNAATSGYVTGAGVAFAAGDILEAEFDTDGTYDGTTGSWNLHAIIKIARIG